MRLRSAQGVKSGSSRTCSLSLDKSSASPRPVPSTEQPVWIALGGSSSEVHFIARRSTCHLQSRGKRPSFVDQLDSGEAPDKNLKPEVSRRRLAKRPGEPNVQRLAS